MADAAENGGTDRIALPYVDNAKAILLTIAINVAVVLVFFWPDGVVFNDILIDSFVCVVITVIADMAVVRTKLKKLRAAGQMPSQVPVSSLMQRLPQNPVALTAVYIAIFAPLTVGGTAALLMFFDMTEMSFVPWMTYKILFAVILSVIVTEYCIFRYVQPDWANADGTGAGSQNFVRPVKDPLPKVSLLRELYGSVTGYIALNLVRGVIMGSVAVTAGSVIIDPTAADAMFLRGLIFGFMTGFLVTNGVLRKMNGAVAASSPETMTGDRWFAWMPVRRFPLVLLMSVCMSIFTCAAFGAFMAVFGIPELNFFHFIIFITIYAMVMGRPLSYVVMRRCMQPDYVRHRLEGKESDAVSRLLEKYL